MSAIVFTNAGSAGAYAKTIIDGSVADSTITFVTPTDTATTTYAAVCGEYTYSIHSDGAGANFAYNAAWAVISEATGTYTLTIDTREDLTIIGTEASKSIEVWIRARMNDYSSREIYTKIDFTIT